MNSGPCYSKATALNCTLCPHYGCQGKKLRWQMWVRGGLGIKPVKAMSRRKASCSLASLYPWDPAWGRGGARPGESKGLQHSGRSREQRSQDSQWVEWQLRHSELCPIAVGCLRGHRILSQPVMCVHFTYLFVPKFKLTHYNHVELGFFFITLQAI